MVKKNSEYSFFMLSKNVTTGEYDLNDLNMRGKGVNNDIFQYYKRASYGSIYDSENGIMDGILNPNPMKTSETKTQNPLTPELKMALVNAYESDPYIQSMLEIINLYTLAGDISAELYPKNFYKFNTKEDTMKELHEYVKEDQAEEFNDFINMVDDMTYLWDIMPIANIQRKVFGTSLVWKMLHDKPIVEKKMKIDFPIGIPLKLKVLDPYYIDQVYVDRETQAVTHYKYTDPDMILVPPQKEYIIPEDKRRKKIPNVNYKIFNTVKQDEFATKYNGISNLGEMKLPVSQMLVFLNTNNQITPNTFGYGASDILPILALSSNTRRINEKILPQINETQYLGVGIIKVRSESNVDMEKLRERINKAGGRFATNADVDYVEIKSEFDMKGTLDQRQYNIRNMLMKFQIPSPMFNFEEITNKATIDTVVTFLGKVIEKERKYIERTLEQQWYRPLMNLFFEDIRYLNLRVKVKLNFPPIDFTSLSEKVTAFMSTYQSAVTTKPETRTAIGLEPFPAEEDKDQEMQFPQMQMMNQFNQQQQMNALRQGAKEENDKAEFGGSSKKKETTKDSPKS
jgi:hypothetical protein